MLMAADAAAALIHIMLVLCEMTQYLKVLL
jgi:hypothetical protein